MTTTPAAGYLLDNAGQQTRDRWLALSALFDEPTFRRFSEIGVRPGWHCLEIGAGGGTVASWLADRVGPSGSVTATDIDLRWIEGLRHPNLTALQHDITRDPLPALTYDVIHCRLVLTHLPHPEAVLGRLVPALRPGGWLVIEEFDTGLLDGACHRPTTEPEHRANRIRSAFARLLLRRGVDLGFPSRLPQLLTARGFDEVSYRASFETGPHIRQLERANLEQIRDALVAEGVSAADLDQHLTDLRDLPVLMPVMYSVVGRSSPAADQQSSRTSATSP